MAGNDYADRVPLRVCVKHSQHLLPSVTFRDGANVGMPAGGFSSTITYVWMRNNCRVSPTGRIDKQRPESFSDLNHIRLDAGQSQGKSHRVH